MNIMVFDVPAENRGALAVLRDFYNEAKYCKNKSIKWIFVISKPSLEETDNIKILRYPWIKKSWFHRLYFDKVISPILVKKYNIDKIFSLQNVRIPFSNVEQILYVHNSLPFINYKFSLKESKILWIYQNIIGREIIKSIRKVDKVIVQAEWMKKACIEKARVKSEKIEVVPPKINIAIDKYFEPSINNFKTFFYPANALSYKNHGIIVEACLELKKHNIKDYKVIFTLDGDENPHITRLYEKTIKEALPIRFRGNMSREEVFELYTKSILIFPSYIETFGLPLLESMLHKGIILASDCPFSYEILEGYENAYFFNPFDKKSLSMYMYNILKGRISYKVPKKTDYNRDIDFSIIDKLEC